METSQDKKLPVSIDCCNNQFDKCNKMDNLTLFDLPPEIFTKIFGLLTVREQGRLQGISKQAQAVVPQLWAKIYDLKVSEEIFRGRESLVHGIFTSFWTHCCDSLLSLSFQRSDDKKRFNLEMTKQILETIEISPPHNLKTLKIGALTQGGTTLKTLANILTECPNLESLSFERSLGKYLKDDTRFYTVAGNKELSAEMGAVLESCPQLKELEIDGVCFPLDFMTKLPPLLENLVFNTLFEFPTIEDDVCAEEEAFTPLMSSLKHFIQPSRNLKSFTTAHFEATFWRPIFSPPLIVQIAEKFPNLERLDLTHSGDLFEEEKPEHFAILAELKMKKILMDRIFSGANRDVIERVFEKWSNADLPLRHSLQSLMMEGAALTGKAARTLANFTALEEISLCSGGSTFSSSDLQFVLSRLPGLKRFCIRNDEEFDDGCIRVLAECCKDLEFLSFTSCPNVSTEAASNLIVSQILGPEAKRNKSFILYSYSKEEEDEGVDFTKFSHPEIATCPHLCRVGGVFRRRTAALASPDAFPCYFRPATFPQFFIHTPCEVFKKILRRERDGNIYAPL